MACRAPCGTTKTIFIKGNHEDFVWLDAQHDPEVLPGLFYLRNGRTMDLGEGRDIIRVGGVGGCFGPADLERQSKHLQGYAKRHYTRDEIETLCKATAIDILLVHDAPAGMRFDRHRRGVDWVSEAAGLDQLVAGVRPRVCFFGHHHTRIDGEVAGVRCIAFGPLTARSRNSAIDKDFRAENELKFSRGGLRTCWCSRPPGEQIIKTIRVPSG